MDDAQIEIAAEVIYSQWQGQRGYVPWVKGGNSLKQDDARRIARKLLTDIAAAPTPHFDPMLDSEIAPRPLSYPLTDYHRAMTEGPLNYTWQDKPHRLVYDLIAAVRYYAAPTPQEADARDAAVAALRAIVRSAELNQAAINAALLIDARDALAAMKEPTT